MSFRARPTYRRLRFVVNWMVILFDHTKHNPFVLYSRTVIHISPTALRTDWRTDKQSELWKRFFYNTKCMKFDILLYLSTIYKVSTCNKDYKRIINKNGRTNVHSHIWILIHKTTRHGITTSISRNLCKKYSLFNQLAFWDVVILY